MNCPYKTFPFRVLKHREDAGGMPGRTQGCAPTDAFRDDDNRYLDIGHWILDIQKLKIPEANTQARPYRFVQGCWAVGLHGVNRESGNDGKRCNGYGASAMFRFTDSGDTVGAIGQLPVKTFQFTGSGTQGGHRRNAWAHTGVRPYRCVPG